MSSDLLLSVCIIAKNEETQIGGCIESVGEIAGEVVVLDTGSTDKTIEIAESLGAEVFTASWEKDFAKARNQCIEHAMGRWILFLDADEKLDPLSFPRIREIIGTQATGALSISPRFINYMDCENERDVVIHYYTRLFPRAEHIRYKGKLHEQLWNLKENANLPHSICDDIVIHHYGYDEKVFSAKEKRKRNDEIILSAIEEEPDNWFHRHNYGVTLFCDKKYYESLEQLHKAEVLAEKKGNQHFDTTNYYYQAQIYLSMGEPEKAIHYCQKALDRKDTYYDIYYIMGRAYRTMGDRSRAFDYLHRACADGTERRIPISRVYKDDIAEWAAVLEIASIYGDELHDYEKALKFYLTIERFKKENPWILVKIFNAYMHLGKMELAEKTCIEYRALYPDHKLIMPEFELLEYYLDRGDNEALYRLINGCEDSDIGVRLSVLAADKLYLSGETEKALMFYLLLLDKLEEKSEENLFLKIGNIYNTLGRYDEGLALLEKAALYYPESAKIYNDMAVSSMGMADFEGARACALKSIEKDPEMDAARFNLAKIEFQLKNHEESIKYLDNLIGKGAFHPDALLYKAAIYHEEGKYNESVALLNQIIAIKPECLEGYSYLIKNYKKLGRLDIASQLEKSLDAFIKLAEKCEKVDMAGADPQACPVGNLEGS